MIYWQLEMPYYKKFNSIMMCKLYRVLLIAFCFTFFYSCEIDNTTESVFEESSAMERRNERIEEINSILTSQKWVAEYQAANESTGNYRIIFDFTEDEKVTVSTDFAGDDNLFKDFTSEYSVDYSTRPQLVFTTGSFHKYLFDYIVELTRAKVVDFEFAVEEVESDQITLRGLQYNTEMILTPASQQFEEDIETSNSLSTDLIELSFIELEMDYVGDDKKVYFTFNEELRKILFQGGRDNNNSFDKEQFINYSLSGNTIVLHQPYEFSLSGNQHTINEIEIVDVSITEGSGCGDNADVVMGDALVPQDVVIQNRQVVGQDNSAKLFNKTDLDGFMFVSSNSLLGPDGNQYTFGMSNVVPDFITFQFYWRYFQSDFNNNVSRLAILNTVNGSTQWNYRFGNILVDTTDNTIQFVPTDPAIWAGSPNSIDDSLKDPIDQALNDNNFYNTDWKIEFVEQITLSGSEFRVFNLTNLENCATMRLNSRMR